MMAKIAECDDYVNSIQVPQLIKAAPLAGGTPDMNGVRPVMFTGGFCIVFPYSTQNAKYAVRCWHAHLDGAQERTRQIAQYLGSVHLPYFVNFQYVEDGIATPKGIMPIVIMDWVDAKPLKKYIQTVVNDSQALSRLADNFLQMVEELHKNGISHGDLQHGNIMVRADGRLVLVDYDSMYVPSLKGYDDFIRGLKGYQHPARWTNKSVTPKADYFSELVIYTSIKALAKYPHLWYDLQMEDTDTLLFSGDDIDSGGRSEIFDILSRDAYLKELVEVMREELSHADIDELRPLEEVEPALNGQKRKKQLCCDIRSTLDGVDSVDANRILQWLDGLDIDTVRVDALAEKLSQAQMAKKKDEERIERQKVVNNLSAEWNTTQSQPQSHKVDTQSVVNDMKRQWEDNGGSGQPYNKEDVENTSKLWK